MSHIWGSPGNLCLVVLDVETCVGPDKRHRPVSVGVAVVRGDAVKDRRAIFVNPGCEVDEITSGIHHITTAHVADEPPLDEVWHEIAKSLAGRPGETVVVAAHHVAFDIPVLRDELARTGGEPLPDLPVLDTAGPLVSLAGLATTKRSLAAILAELGITNEHPHDALSDATATAEAARQMIGRAEAAGFDDLAALLIAAASEGTGTLVRAAPRVSTRRRDAMEPVPVQLPDDHVTAHAHATYTDLPELATSCAALRCPSLAATAASVPTARTVLFELVAELAAEKDVAGTATALGALMPLLAEMPRSLPAARRELPSITWDGGAAGARGVAIAVAIWLTRTTTALGRCGDADPCPECRDGRSCPLDTWIDALVPLAIEPTKNQITSFWNPRIPAVVSSAKSKGAGRGWNAMHRAAPELADRVLRRCLVWWQEDRPADALKAVDQAWSAGCRDPYVAEMRVVQTTRAGREADLRAALADADAVLAARRGSTDPAVASLAVRAAQVEGRLTKLTDPANRRARYAAAKRPPRLPRFLRDFDF